MRKTIVGATFLMFGTGVAAVGALNNIELRGSDTLEDVTKDVLAVCTGATSNGISYIGGGSTTGGNEMVANHQNVSPQSRALSAAEGCSLSLSGAQAEGIVIALDGLAIAVSTSNGQTACGGRLDLGTVAKTVACTAGSTGCATGTYTIGNSIDVLRLLWAGKHKGASDARERDCDSSARRALVASWSSIFEDSCAAGTCASGVSRLWRRADLSGTTDTFLGLVGLTSMPLAKNVTIATPKWIDFCNAWPFGTGTGAHSAPADATCTGAPATPGCRFGGESDVLDLDPIQTSCGPNEELCEKNGKLGVVQVVDVPGTKCDPANPGGQGINLTQAELWYLDASNTPRICDTGVFRLMLPSNLALPGTFLCQNGLKTLFGKCWQPVKVEGTVLHADCVAKDFPVQGFQANGILRGGIYNRILKDINGNYLLKPRVTSCSLDNGAYTDVNHLIQATKVSGTTGQACNNLASATELIGCLTQANSCSLGFAGREALSPKPVGSATPIPGIFGTLVQNVAPDVDKVQNLVTLAGPVYPLARKLFFNTVKGFQDSSLDTGEKELAKCMANDSIATAAAVGRNFIASPIGVFCQDFGEFHKCAGGPKVELGCSVDADCPSSTCSTTATCTGVTSAAASACNDDRAIACGDGKVQKGFGEKCDPAAPAASQPPSGCAADCTCNVPAECP